MAGAQFLTVDRLWERGQVSDNGLSVAYDHDLSRSRAGDTHWIAARADFFLPVRVLAEVFRGKLLAKLEAAINRAKIPARRDDDPRDLLKRAARSMNGQVMDQGRWTTSKAK